MELDDVEVVIIEGELRLYLAEGVPFVAALPDGTLVPHLFLLSRRGHCFLPKIVVDSGAVEPIGRGADVLAPGVRRVVGEFKSGAIVAVINESERLAAVARSLYSSEEISQARRGKVALTLHHPNDPLWKLGLSLIRL